MFAYILTDNGSLRPEVVENLREVAAELQKRLKIPVVATSLAHSHRVDPKSTGGCPGFLLEEALHSLTDKGFTRLLVQPYVIAGGGAIHRGIEAQCREFARSHNKSPEVTLLPPLFQDKPTVPPPFEHIIAERIREVIDRLLPDVCPQVVLVDHGSPFPEAARVRNLIASRVGTLLAAKVRCVTPASMERRDGADFDFNEPLLETVLAGVDTSVPTVVSLLFLQEGRHAGPHGDIAQICARATHARPELVLWQTPPIGQHALFLSLLENRFRHHQG